MAILIFYAIGWIASVIAICYAQASKDINSFDGWFFLLACLTSLFWPFIIFYGILKSVIGKIVSSK